MSQTNEQQRLYQVFSDALSIDISAVDDDLKYNSIKEWDSVAHMILVAQLEAAFDVMLEMDDIIDMNSVAAAKTILSKHGVNFYETL